MILLLRSGRLEARASIIKRAFSLMLLAVNFSSAIRVPRLEESVAIIYRPPRECDFPCAETVLLHCTPCTSRRLAARISILTVAINGILYRINKPSQFEYQLRAATNDERFSFEIRRKTLRPTWFYRA